jgi:hypothetical protein
MKYRINEIRCAYEWLPSVYHGKAKLLVRYCDRDSGESESH